MSSPIVETSSGRVRGRVTAAGSLAFLGIPYAEVGARFQLPSDVKPWTGIRDALECGPPCVQVNSDLPAWVDTRAASEDCLYLNVWTPDLRGESNRPVMVWIHGGHYKTGSAGLPIYNGAALSRLGAVVIGINHRLGAFGYLYLGHLLEEFSDSGNLGQLDLVSALQWIRGNVEAFGGNRDNVTLFGESGGGGKINLLAGMPRARGLYHKAIIQSGSFGDTLSLADAQAVTSELCDELTLLPDDLAGLVNVPAERLAMAAAKVLERRKDPFALGPVLDGESMPSNPYEKDSSAGIAPIPIMLGTTRDEAAYFIEEPATEPVDDDELLGRLLRSGYGSRLSHEKAEWLIERFRQLHPNLSRLHLLIRISSDVFLWSDALRQAEFLTRGGTGAVYLYDFAWKTPCFSGLWSPHGAEIPFVFGTMDYSLAFDDADTPARRSQADPAGTRFMLSGLMMRAWVAFASFGSPRVEGLPEWPAYNLSSRPTMVFDSHCRLIRDPKADERRLVESWASRAPNAK